MKRAAWLAERRAAVEADYTRDASTYDEGYDPLTPTHRSFAARLIATVPADGSLLDAPCGTAPYATTVLEADRRYVGADQSAGMLDQARSKHPDVRFEQLGLQELAFDRDFDGAMCVDAMEHVPPEEWPLVVGNFHRAIRPRGYLYPSAIRCTRGSGR
ncbi:MAG: class I SAM-dependent methyltransferase [Actinomycetota bacterium]